MRPSPAAPRLPAPAALLVVLAASTPAGAAEPDVAMGMRLAPSVLQVRATGGTGLQLGSGVVVARETVVTNCHVTRSAQTVSVVHAGATLPARAQSADMAHDLCLLQVPGLAAEAVALGSASGLVTGRPVLAIGFTGGFGPRISRGRVVALHRWDGAHVVQSSTSFTSGASGGGLFDADGALVGVLTFRLRGGEAHYYAAPVDWLHPRLAPPPRWDDIGPLAGRGFWERRGPAQPMFLRAAALEHGAQWPALARLAAEWARAAADDPEAPYMLGVAEEAQGRHEQAAAAWNHSLRLDADYHRSRMRLARLHHRLGREAEARQALDALTRREPQLGRELAEELKSGAPAGPFPGRRP
ncbi:trypsin-like peptidase domain-containing protein [Caldimonas tepidiphila]|uniref:trypsin-like peptidase domain-containing protein n=1 Tax=Caldimonas tepidiphila TaxID=2315841 RepID=UPI000E5A410E|nr:trypsin-like peptidase domain-containing protein [Caldimonas tepidiphila]